MRKAGRWRWISGRHLPFLGYDEELWHHAGTDGAAQLWCATARRNQGNRAGSRIQRREPGHGRIRVQRQRRSFSEVRVRWFCWWSNWDSSRRWRVWVWQRKNSASFVTVNAVRSEVLGVEPCPGKGGVAITHSLLP